MSKLMIRKARGLATLASGLVRVLGEGCLACAQWKLVEAPQASKNHHSDSKMKSFVNQLHLKPTSEPWIERCLAAESC